MRLVIVRHGRSTANADGVLAGRTAGVALDETGRQQVGRLREPLAAVAPVAAYTSPLERCRETAERAGFPDATVLDELTECDFGGWTGRRLTELAEEDLWKQIQATPSSVTFPGGESMAAMNRRLLDALAELRTRHRGDEVVVVFSHGDPIKAIVADALAVPFDEFQRINISPASVSIVDYSRSTPFVLTVNGDVHALPQLASEGPSVGGGDTAKQ